MHQAHQHYVAKVRWHCMALHCKCYPRSVKVRLLLQMDELSVELSGLCRNKSVPVLKKAQCVSGCTRPDRTTCLNESVISEVTYIRFWVKMSNFLDSTILTARRYVQIVKAYVSVSYGNCYSYLNFFIYFQVHPMSLKYAVSVVSNWNYQGKCLFVGLAALYSRRNMYDITYWNIVVVLQPKISTYSKLLIQLVQP
jgi:hypothetical protein